MKSCMRSGMMSDIRRSRRALPFPLMMSYLKSVHVSLIFPPENFSNTYIISHIFEKEKSFFKIIGLVIFNL